MNNKSTIITIAVIIALVVGIGAFALSSDEAGTGTDTTTPAPESSSVEESSTVADQILDIDMSNFKYSENQISAQPGETITINLSVSGGSHNFVIDELDVKSQTFGSGGSDSVTFTIPEDAAGKTFAYYCDIGNHRALGMEGQLVVSNN